MTQPQRMILDAATSDALRADVGLTPLELYVLALVGMSLDALTRGHWIHYSGDDAAIECAARVAKAEAR